MEVLKENPFVVLTPDDKAVHNEVELSNAQIIHKLFVDVFEDFKSIPQQGHVFLNGPRGSGKSMMFRFLLPDCQLIDKKTVNYNELPFFSIHIPIKLTSINNPEYELIKDYGNSIFNEHVLCIYFADLIFDSFTKLNFINLDKELLLSQISKFYNNNFLKRLKQCGGNIKELPDFNPQTPEEAFSIIQEICSDLFVEANQYLKRNVQNLKFPNQFSAVQYNGPLCDYLSFLFPLLKDLKQISSLFPNKPFFLLIDDADNLTDAQVVVLNTWVSYRTNSEVSLKISTQLNYPSYNTINGTNIDSPHDYYDINILTTYSSSKDIYNKRVRQIIERRLNFFYEGKGLDISPDDFFPNDLEQEKRINIIKECLRENYKEGNGRGATVNDDIKRYAIPDYIKSLKGTSKSGSTFKYAGFDMLVSISSGVIRHFLTPASKMFNAQFRDLKLKNDKLQPIDVLLIEPSIQNEEIRNYSIVQLFDEYDKYTKDKLQLAKDEKYLSKIAKLRNLIESIGGLFSEYITSTERSERKVFSFAITGFVDPELKEVIDLGVRLGYFHKSTIGKKNGTGKTRLYVLSRILAPHFLLDPTSFAGYQFFTSEKLMRAMLKPDSFIKEMLKIKEGEEEKETLQAKFDFDYPLEN
ncbi:MAG: hypothetical protein Q8R22_04325 [Flavobacterium sp.]|uniref:ORC-CDC6 family AAA ATPase n=1 Tax=Flavobacterium sp. TaxID=239 RepID=UPI002732B80C|nr:hypothetical protein [Flavobacterium sp.]MDP3680038.1 hypothetical protein [Flavobacterium sp.]